MDKKLINRAVIPQSFPSIRSNSKSIPLSSSLTFFDIEKKSSIHYSTFTNVFTTFCPSGLFHVPCSMFHMFQIQRRSSLKRAERSLRIANNMISEDLLSSSVPYRNIAPRKEWVCSSRVAIRSRFDAGCYFTPICFHSSLRKYELELAEPSAQRTKLPSEIFDLTFTRSMLCTYTNMRGGIVSMASGSKMEANTYGEETGGRRKGRREVVRARRSISLNHGPIRIPRRTRERERESFVK